MPYMNINIFFIYMRVSECVWKKNKERERERERGKTKSESENKEKWIHTTMTDSLLFCLNVVIKSFVFVNYLTNH